MEVKMLGLFKFCTHTFSYYVDGVALQYTNKLLNFQRIIVLHVLVLNSLSTGTKLPPFFKINISSLYVKYNTEGKKQFSC
jgi:hypothetical protein